MKKVLAVAAMMLTMAGAASAQGGGGARRGSSPAQRDSTQFDRLLRGIPLNADRIAKAKVIITNARQAIDSLDARAPDYRAKLMLLTKKRNGDLRALLTSEFELKMFDTNVVLENGRGRSAP